MAAAAPWVQEEGALYTRVSVARENVEGLQGWRSDAYAEYGLLDRLTLTGKVERIDYEEASDFNTSGWRSTFRYQVYKAGSVSVTAEAGLLQGAAIGGRNGCDALGGEVRGGVAWSGQWRKRAAFLFGELASRIHEDCERSRAEFGFAQQTSKSIWSITQVWLERGDTNAPSEKYQTELLWRTDAADFSFGYRREDGGAFEEDSVFLALARQF